MKKKISKRMEKGNVRVNKKWPRAGNDENTNYKKCK